ncbi:2507_t:CDS:2, partial [Cetraspora pellucida]
KELSITNNEQKNLLTLVTSEPTSSSKTQMLIEEVRKQQYALQRFKFEGSYKSINSTEMEQLFSKFFADMDEHLKKDPSIMAPVTSDSINGLKHKLQKDDEKGNIKEFHILVKKQTKTIIETIKDQYVHITEVQQKQHDEQMEIFRQLLMKL